MHTHPRTLMLTLLSLLLSPALSQASDAISGGIWYNYSNIQGDDDQTDGTIQDEALILYIDDRPEDGPWQLSAEMRFGPGSFTDSANNATGDSFTLHKGWLGYHMGEGRMLRIGKSQVPFGWKTANFWPGDILLGGYGDQMDVGVKYSRSGSGLDYDLAYYHADDWGATSTDSTDDNGHWGSASSYRKLQTWVLNLAYPLAEDQQLGLSHQSGKLGDLTTAPVVVDDSHRASNLYYIGTWGAFTAKAQFIDVYREIPGTTDPVENQRSALELSYQQGEWFFVLDSSQAQTDTPGNTTPSITGNALGARYDYGPGWFYLEYLTQDGFIDANGDITSGDFQALYATLDYYF